MEHSAFKDKKAGVLHGIDKEHRTGSFMASRDLSDLTIHYCIAQEHCCASDQEMVQSTLLS